MMTVSIMKEMVRKIVELLVDNSCVSGVFFFAVLDAK